MQETRRMTGLQCWEKPSSAARGPWFRGGRQSDQPDQAMLGLAGVSGKLVWPIVASTVRVGGCEAAKESPEARDHLHARCEGQEIRGFRAPPLARRRIDPWLCRAKVCRE